eukprot:m.191107 g.191107  ORF g.191107 m.191107 type:complete len:708 (+) comp14835_c0_seq1:65-2188(+)
MSRRQRPGNQLLRAVAHGRLVMVHDHLDRYGSKYFSSHASDGCSPAHLAAKRGHFEILRLLFKFGAHWTDTDADKKRNGNVLHYACWGGDIKLVRWLLDEQGAELGSTDIVGNTPLLYAIYGGHRHIVEDLLVRGRSLRERNHKNHTAILQASCGGHLELVQWLLTRGFTLNDRDNDGNTALLFAAWGGHLDLMQYLLQNGASLDETNFNGHSVFLSAANGGRTNVVEWLLCQQRFNIHETNNNGDTALLLAAYGGHRQLVERLLELGASLTDKNSCGFTPLLSAANGAQLEMSQWLLQNGSSITEADNDGYTSLILAACGGSIPLVEFFLRQGASLSERNQNGDTSLLLAAYCGHTELVRWLLRHGSRSDERNNTRMGVLISAANGGQVDTVRFLLEELGTDSLEEMDEGGYTPLLLAAQRGHLDVVQFLAAHGANLAARTLRHNHDAVSLAVDFPAVQEYLTHIIQMKPIQIACDLKDVDRAHELLRSGSDVELNPHPLALASTVSPYANANEVDDSLCTMIQAASLPWEPATHHLFGESFRRNVVFMLWVKKQIDIQAELPFLPQEIWMHVLSFFQRSWFQDAGTDPVKHLFPIKVHESEMRAAWRRRNLLAIAPADESCDMDTTDDELVAEMASLSPQPADEPVMVFGAGADNDVQTGRVTPKMALEPQFDEEALPSAFKALDYSAALDEAEDAPLHVKISWV